MIGRWKTSRTEQAEEVVGFDSFDLRLGDVMRGERATLGKSLLDVQRELKIKATYIAAIENADPTAFDTQGFIAGYVRSYARYLELDPEWAYQKFCSEAGFAVTHGLSAGATSVEKAETKSKTQDSSADPFANPNASWVPQKESMLTGIEPGAVGSVAVLSLMVAVLGFGGWSVLKEIQRVDFAPIEQTPGVLSELPDIEGDTSVLADAGALIEGAGLATPPSAEELDRLYRPQALDVPVMAHRDAPISTLSPHAVGVLAGAAPSFGAAPEGLLTTSPTLGGGDLEQVAALDGAVVDAQRPVQVFGADAAEVAVFAVRPAWVRIKSADGAVIFEKILDAGEHYVLPKTEQAPLLRTGNAGAVYFAVNGTAYGPSGDGPSVASKVALSQEDLVANYELADLEQDAALATYVAELQLAN